MNGYNQDISKTSRNNIVNLSADELSQAIKEKTISCREVMTAYLAQIDEYNPVVNAIVNLRPKEELLHEADQLDQLLANGKYLGWMHGFPFAIKDLTFVKDFHTSKGSLTTPKSQTDPFDSIFVERIRANGAIFIGRTNVPEFGLGSHTFNEVYGITRNAYHPELSAGGSSGGAAAALALKMLPVADGSDMMGSLRNPAAFNNIYGFRPSVGRVPLTSPQEVFFSQLATDGPMGRTVTDVFNLLKIQSGYSAKSPLSCCSRLDDQELRGIDTKDIKIGWLGDYDGYLNFEKGVLECSKDGLAQLISIGCSVEDCKVDFDLNKVWECWKNLRHWLICNQLSPLYQNEITRKRLKPEAIWEIESGLNISGKDIYDLSIIRTQWYNALLKLFEKYDYLALPTAQVFPFNAEIRYPEEINNVKMDTYHRWMEVVIGPSLAGLPTLSMPIGFNDHHLPLGIQIIGKPLEDLAVLNLAFEHEKKFKWGNIEPALITN